MADFALRDGVHLAWSGDIAIFLDLDADRYSCLGPRDATLLRRGLAATGARIGGADAPAWSTLTRALVKARLVVDVCGASQRGLDEARALPAVARALSVEHATPGALTRGRIFLACAHARRLLRTRPLRDVVAAQVARSARSHAAVLDAATCARMQRTTAQFLAARGWFMTRDACLAEALSLILRLHAEGLHAHWVFGVSAPPFEAHCWVQSGDLVLNDTRDHVARYTPILVA